MIWVRLYTEYLASVFSKDEDIEKANSRVPRGYKNAVIEITVSKVIATSKIKQRLFTVMKFSRPDNPVLEYLKESTHEILTVAWTFNKSVSSGIASYSWKIVNIAPLFQ